MNDEIIDKSWFKKHIETAAKKDTMGTSQRIFDIIFGAGFVILFLTYFLLHHVLSTGFFTLEFGLAHRNTLAGGLWILNCEL